MHNIAIQSGNGGSASSSRGKNVNQVAGGNFWQQRNSKSTNDESTNIYKKPASNPISPAANAWTARTPTTTANSVIAPPAAAASTGMNISSRNAGSGSGSGSEEFGFAFEPITIHNNNNNNNNGAARRNNNNNSRRHDDDAPSLNEAFPTLPTTTRKGNPHPNQAPKPKGVWGKKTNGI